MRDSISSTSPGGMIGITDPPPVPVLSHDSTVSDLLLDDVAQIQNVAAS